MAEIIIDGERDVRTIMCTKTSGPFYKCSLFSEPDRSGIGVLEEIMNYDKISDINITSKTANIKKAFIYSDGADILLDKPVYCRHGKYEETGEYFITCEE